MPRGLARRSKLAPPRPPRAGSGSGPGSDQATRLGISYEGTHLSYLEVDARAGYRIFGDADSLAGTLFLGYRFLDVEYEDDKSQSDLTINVQLNGPYLGFELAF